MFLNFRNNKSGDLSVLYGNISAIYVIKDDGSKNEGKIRMELTNGSTFTIASYSTVEICNNILRELEVFLTDILKVSKIRNYQFEIPDESELELRYTNEVELEVEMDENISRTL